MKVSKAKTLKALRESQQHWRENVTGEKPPSTGMCSCALCRLFLLPTTQSSADCVGCPVFKKTGKQYCKGTPYAAAAEANHNIHANPSSNDVEVEFRKAALQELEFLLSLSVNATTKTKGK